MSRMAELAAQRDEENQATGWDDYLAWEESERELNEQALKDADKASSTQH